MSVPRPYAGVLGPATEGGADVFAWLAAVAREPGVSHFAVRVALVLTGYFSRGRREAWPKQSTLAETLNATPEGVRKALLQLRDAGFLEVRIGQGRGDLNRYIMVPAQPEPPTAVGVEGPTAGGGSGQYPPLAIGGYAGKAPTASGVSEPEPPTAVGVEGPTAGGGSGQYPPLAIGGYAGKAPTASGVSEPEPPTAVGENPQQPFAHGTSKIEPVNLPMKVERASRKKPATDLPPDFPTSDLIVQAQDRLDGEGLHDLSADREAAKFRDHHTAKGSRFVSWPGAWLLWTGNAIDWSRRRTTTSSGGRRSGVAWAREGLT